MIVVTMFFIKLFKETLLVKREEHPTITDIRAINNHFENISKMFPETIINHR